MPLPYPFCPVIRIFPQDIIDHFGGGFPSFLDGYLTFTLGEVNNFRQLPYVKFNNDAGDTVDTYNEDGTLKEAGISRFDFELHRMFLFMDLNNDGKVEDDELGEFAYQSANC